MEHDRHMRLISSMAAKQDAVIDRAALLRAGVDRRAIDRLRHRAFLNDVFRGVYLVGVPTLNQRAFIRSGLLHAGPDAWPTHRTGLELRRLLLELTGRVTVTTRRRNVESPVSTLMPLTNGRLGELTVHSSTPHLAVPLETVGGFKTTLLPRTLIDTAGESGARVLGWAWKEADYRGVLDPVAIRAELAAHPRSGAALVNERLRNAYPLVEPGTKLRSRAGEYLFLGIVREAGLPAPEVNVRMWVCGIDYEADFFYRSIGLVVEIDGPQHEHEEAKSGDKVRDLDFFVEGLDVLRLTTERMRTHREWCIERIRAAYARQSLRAA